MAKKSFLDKIENPAEMYISKPEPKKKETKPEQDGTLTAPAGYHIDPRFIENKSKRFQMLMKPSLLDKLRAKAQSEGRSVNDVAHTILEGYFGEER